MYFLCWAALMCTVLYSPLQSSAQPFQHGLHFAGLATSWDEGLPLGNGMLGVLIWQKNENLHFSLDRADLWDRRPMKGLHRKEFSYQWVIAHVKANDYGIVQRYFDEPYDREPAPTKIPGAALEFNTKNWGVVLSAELLVDSAVCQVRWKNGTRLQSFVHARAPVGMFRFDGLVDSLVPILIAPAYQGPLSGAKSNALLGDDLSRLGYSRGKIIKGKNSIRYIQSGWGGFSYEVIVAWRKVSPGVVEGVWRISTKMPGGKPISSGLASINKYLDLSFQGAREAHQGWWKDFWSKSAIQVPDSAIENQWYLEMYKLGASSRLGAPPISLQAVWTADNGRIPPWKGDYHHDLNTELSYWPAYSSNHLDAAIPFLDHLEQNRSRYEAYTRRYFGKPGLDVPGVTTIDGTEMGGWIQYSLSPTVSAWLSQHFYLQWRYSLDSTFLRKRAYPWIRGVAQFLENITYLDKSGCRKLPISSSPEINDNDVKAWFFENTNYDLALMKFNLHIASELAGQLGYQKDAAHWKKLELQFCDFALSANKALRFAPSLGYNQSHRHFSNAIAIHPLGLIKYEDGPESQAIIKNTLQLLDSIGPSYWCGYSYSWLANLKARAKDGEGAALALGIFVKAFCLQNSFHANGDQTKSGYSSFTYRPFTLEGNFAFAAGLQEMLLQSYSGTIEIMPAVPRSWKNISFKQLRAEGAYLVDAIKLNGQVDEIKITSEQGGMTKLDLPFKTWFIAKAAGITLEETGKGKVLLTCKKGGVIVIMNGYE